MSTTPDMPSMPGPEQPAIPLAPAVRTAYEELYSHYEEAIENTDDTALESSLMDSQLAVSKIISLDNAAIIQKDSASFAAVLKQIGIANKGLTDLQAQIAKVAGNIAKYATIVSGINKVLSMVPGI